MSNTKTHGGVAMLTLRLVNGTLLALHGGQKLFGWWDGPGMKKWTEAVDSMGAQPASVLAPMAAASEFGGGILTALGYLNPLGPLAILGSMMVATRKAHWGKPVFVTKGGAELPLTNIAIASLVAIEGPGQYSLDRWLGVRLPGWMRFAAALATLGGVLFALRKEVGQAVDTLASYGKMPTTPA